MFDQTGVRDQDVEYAVRLLHGGEEPVKIHQVRRVALDGSDVSTDLRGGRIQRVATAAEDDHVRPFIDELLRDRQADSGGPARHDRDFPF